MPRVRGVSLPTEVLEQLLGAAATMGALEGEGSGADAYPTWWNQHFLEMPNIDNFDMTISTLSFPSDLQSLELSDKIKEKLVIDEVTMQDLRLNELLNSINQTETQSGKRLLEYVVNFPLSDKNKIEERQDAFRELKDIPMRGMLHQYFHNMAVNEAGYFEFCFRQEEGPPPRQETLQATRIYLKALKGVNAVLKNTSANKLRDISENIDALLKSSTVRKLYDSVVDGDEINIMDLDPKTWQESYDVEVVDTLREIAPVMKALKDSTVTVDMSNGNFRLSPRGDGEMIPMHYPLNLRLNLEKVQEKYVDRNALFNLTYSASLIEAFCTMAGIGDHIPNSSLTVPNMNLSDRYLAHLENPADVKTLLKEGKFVTNDYLIDDSNRGYMITGPNSGGKTVYGFGLPRLQVLAQSGAELPATKANMSIADHVFTLRPASKEEQGEGRYMHSLIRGRDILQNATPNSFIAIDDFEGTDPQDSYEQSLVIASKVMQIGSGFAMTTQDRRVALDIEENRNGQYDGISTVQLDYQQLGDKIMYTHKVTPGVGRSIGGVCAKMAGMDSASLDAMLRERGYSKSDAIIISN